MGFDSGTVISNIFSLNVDFSKFNSDIPLGIPHTDILLDEGQNE